MGVLIVLLAALVTHALVSLAAPPPPIETLRRQLVELMLPEEGVMWDSAQLAAMDREGPGIISSLNASGLWPDINYFDSGARSDWPAAEHLRRCLLFGITFNANSSAFYSNASYAGAATSCTAGWLTASPVNSNWWWMQLGTLQCIAKLLLLVPNAGLTAQANANAFPRLTLEDVEGFVGANRVWSALVHVLIGVLNTNATHVDAAFSLMTASYAAVPGGVVEDGLQLDAGFHQHGPLAQMSYAYGGHFMANALSMELAARGTPWALASSPPPSAPWAALTTYLLDGARWLSRGPEWAAGAMGRHNTYFSSQDALGVTNGHYHSFAAYPAFGLAFPSWLPPFDSATSVLYARLLGHFTAYPRGAELFDFMSQVLAGNGSGGVSGHHRFWLSDYSTHQRPGFAFSLHSFSNRTLNTECVNDEGLQNRPMADGLLMTYVTGREYRNHPPVWRWSLAPGITALQQTVEPYSCANAQITDASQRPPFVGGATDGWLGVAAQDLRRTDGGSTLVARKAWFFCEAGVVALGTGIATNGAFNVATSLEQRPFDAVGAGAWVAMSRSLDAPPDPPQPLPEGELLQNANVSWVWHAGVLYVMQLPGSPGVNTSAAVPSISTRNQTGSWANITQGPTTMMIVPTFLAYLHHGNPHVGSAVGYAYAVLPGPQTPEAAVAAYSAFVSGTSVLANSVDLQAVCFSAPNSSTAWVLQVVGWPAASRQTEAAWLTTPSHKHNIGPVSIVGCGRMHGCACPAAEVGAAPGLVQVVLSTVGTLAVTFSDPAASLIPRNASVVLAGVEATGPACTWNGSATTISTPLPTQPGLAGSSVTVQCKCSGGACY